MSYQDIATRLGKAATTINNIVRLLQLPPQAREALQTSAITEGHARAVLALKDHPDSQLELVTMIKRRGWSVRQAEQFVQTHKTGIRTKAEVRQRMAVETPETKQLAKTLQVAVTLRRTAKGGRVELHFRTDEELKMLLHRLRQSAD
ncbi:hypothetical protein HY218_02035 [Candidatus Saccharibacteria bacterium]|nr:hypothetical protein [Candidatus Saccharibacteria bacterium]